MTRLCVSQKDQHEVFFSLWTEVILSQVVAATETNDHDCVTATNKLDCDASQLLLLSLMVKRRMAQQQHDE